MSGQLAFPDYPAFLADIKQRITSARLTAARAVNRELILLYWDIGRAIVEKQRHAGWGDAVVERLASDLRAEFPHARGFSARNVWDMRRLYETYTAPEILEQAVPVLFPTPAAGEQARHGFLQQAVAENGTSDSKQDSSALLRMPSSTPTAEREVRRMLKVGDDPEFLRQLVAEIPWGQHLLILNKLFDPATRLYYLRATARFGWSRNVLLNQIKAGAYERAVVERKTHNFDLALPEYLAEQADEMLKSRYNLEFLGIRHEVKERELEDRLIAHLQRFLLELGYGFCFVGRQYRLALGHNEYFVDLLFYHRFLKALVAFDLKVGAFEPEHAGKMDFYLNLLNETERGPDDRPSIGIILCAEKDDIEVEFALKTKTNPIGVAEYQLQTRLPSEYEGRLPTPEQLMDAARAALAENTAMEDHP